MEDNKKDKNVEVLNDVEIIKPDSKKKQEKDKVFNKYKSFIAPIAMALIGLILFTNSNQVIIYAFYIIGALIAGFGVYNIIRYSQLKKELSIDDNTKLTLGIVGIAFGLLIVLLSGFIQTFLNLLIGLWLILTGTVKLLNIADIMKANKNNGYIVIGESAIYILMGLYSIMVQNIVLTIVGAWMMIGAFFELYKLLRKK